MLPSNDCLPQRRKSGWSQLRTRKRSSTHRCEGAGLPAQHLLASLVAEGLPNRLLRLRIQCVPPRRWQETMQVASSSFCGPQEAPTLQSVDDRASMLFEGPEVPEMVSGISGHVFAKAPGHLDGGSTASQDLHTSPKTLWRFVICCHALLHAHGPKYRNFVENLFFLCRLKHKPNGFETTFRTSKTRLRSFFGKAFFGRLGSALSKLPPLQSNSGLRSCQARLRRICCPRPPSLVRFCYTTPNPRTPTPAKSKSSNPNFLQDQNI